MAATPFTILVNDKQVAAGEVNEKNADVLQQFDLTPHLARGETRSLLDCRLPTADCRLPTADCRLLPEIEKPCRLLQR